MSEMSVVESRLAALGMNMPAPPRPLAYTGTIGLELDVAAAQNAVRLAVLNGLSAARAHLGNLEAIRKVVRLAIYQRTTAEFADHAKVADAASDLLHGLFGAEAAHTRMVFRGMLATGIDARRSGTGV